MINILLPSMGSSSFFKESFFPKPLIEILGKTMLELVMENYQKVLGGQMIYVFLQEDCTRFHLDASVKLLADNAKVFALKEQTAGALCTALMAIDHINNDMPLIIANSDQVIDVDYNEVVSYFNSVEADAGVIVFPNIHPRWSYIREADGIVVEVAEKRPLSHKAIAGFYYYRKGSFFINAAKSAILKQNCVDGKYYVSASMNEIILEGMKVCAYEIEKEQYHSFYSPEKIKEYEEHRRL